MLLGTLIASLATAAPQTRFSSEGEVHSPARLPAQVLQTLTRGDRNDELKRCIEDDGLPASAVSTYFEASAIDVNGDGRADLVVTTGKYCLQGAHAAPFWIFVQTEDGWRTAFETVADELDLRPVKGQRRTLQLVTMNHTAAQLFFVRWIWNGRKFEATRSWRT
jgi:hypothetical protein